MSTSVIVRYRTRPDAAEENVRLIEAVYDALAELDPGDFRYTTYRLADGVTFLHVATQAGTQSPLPSLPAFVEFQRDIAARCDEPPAPSSATIVGSYGEALLTPPGQQTRDSRREPTCASTKQAASIEASRELVWRVLVDSAGWTDWDSGVSKVDGRVAQGEKLDDHRRGEPGSLLPRHRGRADRSRAAGVPRRHAARSVRRHAHLHTRHRRGRNPVHDARGVHRGRWPA